MELKEPKDIKDCRSLTDFAYRNRYQDLKNNEEFFRIFGKRYRDFCGSYVTGFDIVDFDKWVNPQQVLSCSDCIKQKYGERAKELIKELIS